MKSFFKVLGGLVIVIVVLSALNWCLAPADATVDRAVVKNSHQYKEGMAQQAAIYESQLVELENQLMTADNPEDQQQIENQISFVRVQLRAITINK